MRSKSIRKLIVTSAMALLAPLTLAHTGLVSTTPIADSQLEAAPEELELVFAGELRLLRLELQSGSGETLGIGFKPSPSPAQRFTVSLPSLPAGSYTANWVAMGLDGHKMSGSFGFAVGAADNGNQDHAGGHQH